MKTVMPYIEQKAVSLLHESGCFELPVDVKKCAKFFNIDLKPIALSDEVSGYFIVKDTKPQIGYNSSHGKNRVRFTIAHEIGHFILHKDENDFFIDKFNVPLFRDTTSSSGEIQREKEANSFAAALLMPEGLINEEINNYFEGAPQNKDLINFLAEKFEVSKNAMTYRLMNLDLLDLGYKNSIES